MSIKKSLVHTVSDGEDLETIAFKYNISTRKVLIQNAFSTNYRISDGEKIEVPIDIDDFEKARGSIRNFDYKSVKISEYDKTVLYAHKTVRLAITKVIKCVESNRKKSKLPLKTVFIEKD